MKIKLNKGKILKTIILILPAIIFIFFISLSSPENNQEKDENPFNYYQPWGYYFFKILGLHI